MFASLKAWYRRATAKPVKITGLSFPVLFLPEPEMFENGIEFVNDDNTPMLFVVKVLKEHTGISEGDASVVMAMCHSLGGIVLPMPSCEAADEAVKRITEAARHAGHPFTCRRVCTSSVKGGD